MTNPTIAHSRLINQQLIGSELKTPKDVVSWMGAMQAQDYNMAKWAVGIRIPDCTNNIVQKAFDNGEILRTHIMRPTWHFVSPEDIRWMLQLTAPKIKSSTRSRDRDLEITEEVYNQTNRIIEKTLEGYKYLTKEELAKAIEKNNIHINPARITHFLMRAELDGIICSGAMQNKKHTYALLEERIPKTSSLSKDEALAKFASIYFRSHGAATLQDFIWWSGLSATDARHALEMVKSRFTPENIDSQIYWMNNSIDKIIEKELILLLPAFDEYIISYKDRKAVITSEHHSKAISSNGIFRPVIIKNGQVTGVWKKSTAKNKLIIPVFFEQQDQSVEHLINQASEIFKNFNHK